MLDVLRFAVNSQWHLFLQMLLFMLVGANAISFDGLTSDKVGQK